MTEPPPHPDAADSVAEGYGDAQRLALLRSFGGIGFYERNLRTDAARWDPGVWAVRGLAPRDKPPGFDEALKSIVAEDREALAQLFKRSLQHCGRYDHRYRIQGHDGRVRQVHSQWEVRPGSDGRPALAVGMLRDDTETLRLAESVGAAQAQLRMAAELAGIATWSLHRDRGGMAWDEPMRRLHGCEGVADLDDYLRRHVHDDDRAALEAGLAELLRGERRTLDLDLRIVRADGSLRSVTSRTAADPAGSTPALYGVMLDVTERHSAEQLLRDADARSALATRGAGIGTWELSLDDELVWWDEQMFRLRGVEPRAMPLRREDTYAFLHPDDRDATGRTIAAANDSAAPLEHEFRIVRPDGSVRWLASRSIALTDAQGRPRRRIGINRDITDVRAAEAEREARLLAQRESRAKSRFLARMSHELRTPLNAVLGFAQLLQADGVHADPAAAAERVGHILHAGEHLLGLINDVLDLSALDSGEVTVRLQPVALAAQWDAVLPLLQQQARRHGVTIEATALGSSVMADPMRLRQVLINLLSNAIKYNRAGGRVRVDAQAEDGVVRLRVTDTGRGMTASQLDQLFEPFNRLGIEREGIEGTGIGLTIVRTVLEHMGGSVHASSEPGVGSCFEVRLVAAGAAAASRAEPIPSAAAPQRRGAAPSDVLYIEDNAVNMLIVAEFVGSRSDLRFHGAVDGQRGVAMAQRLRPALVIVDMHLPDIDGLEVLRRLRADARTAGLRCVALSANAIGADIERALDAGFDAYWTKPLKFAELAAALDAQFGPAPPA